MLLTLTLFVILFLSPLTAWAYFDPGFGGYLVNSILSLIATGFAFVSAAIIYFFRTFIGKRLLFLWQKYRKASIFILLSVFCIGNAFLGALLYHLFHKSFFIGRLWARSDFDPALSNSLSNFIILLILIAFTIISAVLIYFFRIIIGQWFLSLWQKHRKLCIIVLLSFFSIASSFFGAFLLRVFPRSPANHPHVSSTNIIDPQHMYNGYNLFDGELIDENRQTLKRWSSKGLGVLDQNGDYYGGQEDKGLWGRYTWDDKVIWEKHFPIYHELYLSPQGTIFTFTREFHHYNNYKVDFDIILEYDKNGNELQRFSFWDHLKEFQPYHAKFAIDVAPFTPFMFLWQKIFYQGTFDYFHINSFFIIPPNPLEGKNPAFRPGNWLISIFHGSMVFILDQSSKKVLWHAVANEINGGLEGQHSASMLPDGDILLFDNGINRGTSRILIIDPMTLKIKWEYKNEHFFSAHEGYVQALPNGNFLVTESTKGHVFELTPDKRIVWEYYYADNDENDIYRMTRYPKEIIDRFLKD